MNEVSLESVQRLTQDLRKAAATLTEHEVRYLVDLYYQLQKNRIRAAHQIRTNSEFGEPHEILKWALDQFGVVERQIPGAMKKFCEARVPGQWLLSIHGIGPVLGAGLLAHIEIDKAQTAGAIWRFAGLDPTLVWNKKQKRPWNARLKTLCWKVGDSFVKQRNSPKDVYGKIYDERKALEVERNVSGANAETAAKTLEDRKIGKNDTRKAYEAGLLPDGRIDLRARRYAVKLFLSHLHHVMWENKHGEPPVKPYILNQSGHVHFLKPPGWPLWLAVRSESTEW